MNKKMILIVADDAAFNRAMSARLTAEGFEPIATVGASEAMIAIRRREPDLIIVDLTFPPDVGHGGGVPWDGFLIINWLRRMGSLTTTPAILVTSTDPTPHAERARSSGFSGLFQKNVDPAIFLGSIHRLLGATTPTAA